MKFSYELIIKNETEDHVILEQKVRGISRSKKGCLKSVRREINGTIKGMLEQIEQTETKCEE